MGPFCFFTAGEAAHLPDRGGLQQGTRPSYWAAGRTCLPPENSTLFPIVHRRPKTIKDGNFPLSR
eukprot:9503837-Pyramimonas_sp.AAC.1